ncbi:PaaI family thioesterase [Scopulibacillus cellulosilyticus]|uniref:PaaI family thioesterase n=1 Tax=Scopulibacillus cellulosilyticus TaxID=2665665 RepID=A0ABW2PYW6_9BACL
MNEDKKYHIKRLLADTLAQAGSDDLDALEKLLQGIRSKQNKKSKTYLNGVLNYQGQLTEDKKYEAEIELTPFVLNPLKIVHGGITATFADTVMGTLVNELLPENKRCVTSELKLNYLKPATGSKLKCKAELVHRGSHICFVTANILTEDEEIAAYAAGSFFIISKPERI